MALKKREEMKDVLVKKLKERTTAAGISENKAGEVVEKNVDKFLEEAAITENNLKRLEKNVAKESGAEEIFDAVSAYSAPMKK